MWPLIRGALRSDLLTSPTSMEKQTWNGAKYRSHAGDRDSGLGENEILFVKFSVGIPRQVNTNISLPVFVEGQTKLIYRY